jgi:hypothetical protein
MCISECRFLAGERVVIREALNGKVWTVRPVMVIEDSEVQFVSYLAPGTLISYLVEVERGEKRFSMRLSGEWELDTKEFHAPGILRIAPRDKPFEVFATVLPNAGAPLGTELLRAAEPSTPRVRHNDETLDLVGSRDFTSWDRPDGDELAMAVAMGVYGHEKAQCLLNICSIVEDQLTNGTVPGDRSWHD